MQKQNPPPIVIGTHVRCAQPECGPGLVYRIEGAGKKIRYSVVCLDGEFHDNLTEAVLRGKGWTVRRRSPASAAEVQRAVARVRQHLEARQRDEAQQARQRAEAAARIRENQAFAHLTPGNDPHSGRLAKANIVRVLRRAFGRNFAVRLYAFGHLRVVWTDGPTLAAVEAEVGRFRAGHQGSVSAWCATFGGAQCLQLERNASAALINRAIDQVFSQHADALTGIERPHLEEFTSGHLWGTNVPGEEDNLQLIIQSAIDSMAS